jgi:glycosyltransferase involved in cell wall biosynthesis
METMLFDSSFVPSAEGHGGQHRILQVVELIRRAGFEPLQLPEGGTRGRGARWAEGARLAVRGPFTLKRAHRFIPAYGYQRDRIRAALEKHRGPRVLVWEATWNLALPVAAREAGVHVVAVPQNLEALVRHAPEPLTRDDLPHSFEHEVRALAAAATVFTISREEQWLLRLRGVDADYLPTFPPDALVPTLNRIRERRAAGKPHRYLVLVNMNNPPTAAGTIDQLKMLSEIAKRRPLEVDVAGFGTERLRGQAEGLTFHGSVSTEKLEQLLISARALLLHQQAAAGAITRIPEMLQAGIPVIASAVASRSAAHLKGVEVYDDQHELEQKLEQPFSMPPLPPRPVEGERRFIDCLKRLAGRTA